MSDINPLIGEEIKKLRISKRLTLKNFAKSLGLSSPAQISSWEKNYHTPSFNNLLKIKDVYGLDLVSIVNNHYSNPNRGSLDFSLSEESTSDANFLDKILFVILDDYCEAKESYLVPSGFLKLLNINKDYPKLLVYHMMGDAMSPVFSERDSILIDSSFSAIREGAVYLIKVKNFVYVRRISVQDGKLLLVSQNPVYPSQIFDQSDVIIVGPVIGKISPTSYAS